MPTQNTSIGREGRWLERSGQSQAEHTLGGTILPKSLANLWDVFGVPLSHKHLIADDSVSPHWERRVPSSFTVVELCGALLA